MEMSTKIFNNTPTQNLYRLQLISSEIEYLLALHPADISVDEYLWMMMAYEQIPYCLQSIQDVESIETSLILFNQQSLLLQKFVGIRNLPISADFTTAKELLTEMKKELAKLIFYCKFLFNHSCF
jgi:2-hydroxy-3-keto-5-methylthiopentenyl-1-phosphate phosphatase